MPVNVSLSLCPCQSHTQDKKSYRDCCQPYHMGHAIPQTAEQLMRSRYCAYVLQNVDYIVATTVPAQQKLLDVQAMADWSKQTDWAGLEIISHIPKVSKRHAQVEFKALFHEEGNTTNSVVQYHHELSAFVQIKDNSDGLQKWYFIDPTLQMNVTNKQPCICGSGDKFKRCCGQFLMD